MIVWCQPMEESEAGWGIRPDGYILSPTRKDLLICVQAFEKSQSKYFEEKGIPLPAAYSRTSGSPYPCEIDYKLDRAIWKHGKRPEIMP